MSDLYDDLINIPSLTQTSDSKTEGNISQDVILSQSFQNLKKENEQLREEIAKKDAKVRGVRYAICYINLNSRSNVNFI